MTRRFNLFALAGSLAAMIIYLCFPVLRIAFIVGINGMMCTRFLGFLFILPVLLMGLSMLLSLFTDVRISSASAIIAGLSMLASLLLAPDTIAKYGMGLIQMLGISQEASSMGINSGYISMSSTLVVTGAWGLYVAMALCLAGGVLGLALTSGSNQQPGTRGGNGGSRPASRPNGYANLYRHRH